MKKFSRKEILKLMGLAGIVSTTGGFFNKIYEKDVENITSKFVSGVISPAFSAAIKVLNYVVSEYLLFHFCDKLLNY